MIQTALVRILESFSNLPHQAKPHLDVQVCTPVVQKKIQALRLGIMLKEQALWYFPECKIAVISTSCVYMSMSPNVRKSVKP